MNIARCAEQERLALLAEEMGEALQIIGKILRHGTYSVDPTVRDSPDNITLLQRELGHVKAAMTLMIMAGDLDAGAMRGEREMKLAKLSKWLHCRQNIVAVERLSQ